MSWGCAVGSRASWAAPLQRPRPMERPPDTKRASWAAPHAERQLDHPLERPLDRRASYTDRPAEPPQITVPPRTAEPRLDRIFSSFDRTNAVQCFPRDSSERTTQHADIVVNRRTSMSLESADCALAGQSPADDDDYWKEKAAYAQQRQLYPLQEDLAEWINSTIDTTHITGDNFFSALDNGAELCLLAAAIHDRAREAIDQGLVVGPVPPLRGRCWQRAARRSFYSRDNTENFITFCRELGVHDNLLFESDDLVLHHQPRQVILCLLEVARLATRYGLEPPGLVQLEREIALEEEAPGDGWQFREEPALNDRSPMEAPASSEDPNEGVTVDTVDQTDAESTKSGGTVASNDSDVPLRPTNELDKRVQLVSRLLERGCRCGAGRCSRLLKVKKVGEGRYNIAGRNVFIRLLKGRHMMVRVGGGWDTLEHFLSRHEPCQVRLVAPRRQSTPSTSTPTASQRSGKTTPVDTASASGNMLPTSGTISPLDNPTTQNTKTTSVDKVDSGKISPSGVFSPIEKQHNSANGKITLVDKGMKKHANFASSGKITHIEKDPNGKTSSVDANPTSDNGKISPIVKDRRASVNGKITPIEKDPNRKNTPVDKNLSGKTSPVDANPTSDNGKISPIVKDRRASVNGKITPIEKDPNGKNTPVDKNLSGKTSPVDANPTSDNGKISPIIKNRRASVNVKIDSRSNEDSKRPSLSRRSSAPAVTKSRTNLTLPLKHHVDLVSPAHKSSTSDKNSSKSRAGLVLPLREHEVLVPVSRRKQSAPSFSTPTTPRSKAPVVGPNKSRSMSMAHVEPFCGTERLNGQRSNQTKVLSNGPKKSRSMSLAHDNKSNAHVDNKSPVVDNFCGTERLNGQTKVVSNGPKKSRSMSPALENKSNAHFVDKSPVVDNFCGTERLNQTKSLSNGPKKSRSMSLALENKSNALVETFCGTEQLNQAKSRSGTLPRKSESLASTPEVPSLTFSTRNMSVAHTIAKKTRSMSLANPIEFRNDKFCGTERLNQTKVLSNAPKKSRSMSLALENKSNALVETFCGTEQLNQTKTPSISPPKSQSLASTPEAKSGRQTFKPRSMSLANPIDFTPLSDKSISVTLRGPMTQASIEESIRLSLAASIVDCNSPNRPFLHIKAKYRSPPPREVPPR